jgi:hypothetical protein
VRYIVLGRDGRHHGDAHVRHHALLGGLDRLELQRVEVPQASGLEGPQEQSAMVANGIAHSSMLATSLLIPFLLERGRGYAPTQTAELVLTMQLSLIAGSLGGGAYYARHGAPGLAVGSLAAVAVGLFLLGQVGAELPLPGLFPLVAALGAGQGAFTAINNTAVLSSVGADQRGFASGLTELTRHLGHTLGVSLASSVLATSVVAARIPESGYREGFSAAATSMAALAALGVALVLLSSRRPRLTGALLPGATQLARRRG